MSDLQKFIATRADYAAMNEYEKLGFVDAFIARRQAECDGCSYRPNRHLRKMAMVSYNRGYNAL